MDHQSSDDERNEQKEQPPAAEWGVAPGPDPDPEFYQRALKRIPRWIALVAVLALPAVWWRWGLLGASSFVVGAIGGYWNYVAVCRVADRLSQAGRAWRFGLRSMLRLLFIAVAVFVIIRFTRINLIAALTGLFTPVAAVIAEIIYELTLRHE